MRKILIKNMVTHKQRNQLTSLIFSVALSLLIFIVVFVKLNQQEMKDLTLSGDATISVSNYGGTTGIDPWLFQPVLEKH